MSTQAQLTYDQGGGGSPHTVRLAPGQDIRLMSVVAQWDGSGAGGDFLPCLSLYSQEGVLLQRARPSQKFSAGDTGVVTYAPFLGADGAGGGGAGSAGGGAIDLRNPSVGAWFGLQPLTGITLGAWFYKNGVVAGINGAVICPSGFSTFGVSLGLVSSGVATGNAVIRVATRAVPSGSTPGGAFVSEADEVVAIAGALTIVRIPATGNLGSGPAPGDLLEVQIIRVGTSGSDTLAAPLMMLSAALAVA